MKVHLQYGRNGLAVDIPGDNVTPIEPRPVPGLADEESAFTEAVRDPIGTRPLREIVERGDRLAAMIADLTQPLPSDRLLPLAVRKAGARPRESDHDRQRTGSHRTNTPEELASIVGAEVLRGSPIVRASW